MKEKIEMPFWSILLTLFLIAGFGFTLMFSGLQNAHLNNEINRLQFENDRLRTEWEASERARIDCGAEWWNTMNALNEALIRLDSP